MRAIIDQETCIGCGLCPDICPDVFRMNNENVAETTVEVVPSEAKEACREAAASCPVDAIEIQE